MKKVIVFLAVLSILVLPAIASAATIEPGLNLVGQYLGLGTQDVRITIAQILNVAMGLLGLVAVVIILLGGLKWMTAMGAEDKIKNAKNMIIAGIIGLVIILSSYAIATYVVQNVLNATT